MLVERDTVLLLLRQQCQPVCILPLHACFYVLKLCGVLGNRSALSFQRSGDSQDGRRHAMWALDAGASTDKITGYWIKCNFVLTGPADKVHAGFERTFPGFKYRGS